MNLRLATIALAAFASLALGADDEVRGRLCITGMECRDAACGMMIDAADARRTYTFQTKVRTILGVLGPDQLAVDCNADGAITLRAPRKTDVLWTLANDKGLEWKLRRGERESSEGIALRMPHGNYTLTAEAMHFARFRKSITISPANQTVVAELKPLPILSGVVVDARTRRPVAGVVLLSDGDSRAVTDTSGKYVLEADPEKWPAVVRTVADGYAEASLFVPRARIGATLPEIALQRGGTIRVAVEAKSETAVTAIELLHIVNHGHTLGNSVRTIAIARDAHNPTVSFDYVEPGDYLVLAKGNRETERFGVPVTVEARQDAAVTLAIVPFQVRFHALMEGAPVRSAHFVLRNRDMQWQANANTDDIGAADLTLWQGGRMNATLEIPGAIPFMERRTLDDGQDAEWLMEVPSREITGVAVDGASGRPLPGAAIHLSMKSVDGYQLAVSTTANEQGVFRFAPVAYGEHVLKAAAKGYPPVVMTYSFLEPEQHRDLRVVLDEAKAVRVAVLNSQGLPVAGARAIDFAGLQKRGAGTTDAGGVVSVLVSEGEVRDVFIIPRDGSFAVVQLRSEMDEITARVPDGTARIVVQTESKDHAPISGLSVVIRYNGRVLPFEVMQAFAREQGQRTRSGADGRIVLDHMPPGVYELWPVGSAAELVSLSMGVGPEAPVRMTVTPGENVAVMSFAEVAAR
jgi:hypothetical protein